VEGDDDIQFFKSLLKRYGRNAEEFGYFVNAWGKDLLKHLSVALLSTGKEIVVAMDYDKQNRETLIQSLINVLESRSYKVQRKDNVLEIEGNPKITLLPMGLYNDERLKQIGITQFEMEDYCLKLIEVDENLRKWAGMTLEELIKNAKHSEITKDMNLSKSSSLLKLLAIKKDKAYKDIIDYIISNASDQALEKVITRELKEFLL
jgi:hypothetical protein